MQRPYSSNIQRSSRWLVPFGLFIQSSFCITLWSMLWARHSPIAQESWEQPGLHIRSNWDKHAHQNMPVIGKLIWFLYYSLQRMRSGPIQCKRRLESFDLMQYTDLMADNAHWIQTSHWERPDIPWRSHLDDWGFNSLEAPSAEN